MESKRSRTRSTEAVKSVDVSPDELQALTPERLKELESRFGLEVQIRSSSAGIAQILGELDRGDEMARLAAYDRGFDRTFPGYDKFYDRDRNMELEIGDPAEILPAELAKRVRPEELGKG